MQKIRKEIEFEETTNPEEFAIAVVDLANPEQVLTDTTLLEKEMILPKISLPGHYVDDKYKDLVFHFVVTPIFNDVIDFRLTASNQYEFLTFDGKTIDEFSDEFIARCANEMGQDFEERSTETTYHIPAEDADGIDIQFGAPSWCQYKFQRELNEEEMKELDRRSEEEEDFDHNDFDCNYGYVTDYTDPGLQDENGEPLEFIAQLNEGSVFGVYYLFFSPTTRLVRQFFLCT